MAASDYTQLPEPDVRHMRPERGVQDDSTAQAITGFGELALEAGAMYKEKKDKEALAELEGELEAEREDVLSEQDQAVVDKEGKNVDRLARAVKAAPTKEYEGKAKSLPRVFLTAFASAYCSNRSLYDRPQSLWCGRVDYDASAFAASDFLCRRSTDAYASRRYNLLGVFIPGK